MSGSIKPLDAMRGIAGLDTTTRYKAVLWALALRTNNETGECWPSYRTIATDAGMSPSTAKRTIHEMTTPGLEGGTHERLTHAGVHLSKRARPIMGKLEADSNVYRLRIEVVSGGDHVVSGADHVVSACYQGGPEVTPRVVSGADQGGPEVTQELLTELPIGTAHGTIPGSSEPAPLHLTVVEGGTKTKKPKSPKKEATPEHRELIAHYEAAFERVRGYRPEIAAKDHVAANRLLGNGRTIDQAKAIVDRGFADTFVAEKKPDLSYIAANLNTYIGTAPVTALRPKPLAQQNSGPRAWTIGKAGEAS